MSIKTKIEWCDSTINPIMGCTGCALRKNHCYAAVLCARYAGRKGWPKSFNQPEFFSGRLEKAVRWKDLTGKTRADKPWLNGSPRHIFVNNLSDGFCPDVDPWEWLASSLPSMHLSPHIWLLLTKWPSRMLKFFKEWNGPIPSNFHLGVSVENQDAADERIPILARIPAAVRFVSLEPMLGTVNLTLLEQPSGDQIDGLYGWREAGTMERIYGLDWVICGGESGPGARPMHPDWVRGIRDQCQAAGVPFFFKSWGAWKEIQFDKRDRGDVLVSPKRGIIDRLPDPFSGADSKAEYKRVVAMCNVGKKAAGRLLDGREWNEMPEVGK